MLVEFSVKNFRSFRDEQTLSLVASADKTLPGNCAAQGKQKLLKTAAVYGANASGKSNLIKAAAAMREMVLNSAGYNPNQKLGITPFLLDAQSQDEPSMFEMMFYHNGVRYQYGFSATSKRVEEEWLVGYPKSVGQKWFERVFNKKTSAYDWKYSTLFKGEKVALAERTRENALFLSVGAQWNNPQLSAVYEWFERRLRIIDSKHNLKPITADLLSSVDGKTREEKGFRKAVVEIMKAADFGISGIEVKKAEIDTGELDLPEGTSREFREMYVRYLEERFEVEVLHENVASRQNTRIPLEEESDGTQEFFKLIGPWLTALQFGITILIDELEASLHSLLTRELVLMVQIRELNKSGAQLVFATHDTTLLDPELFRRDQIWFTEKDKGGGTQLCPLSDYKPRKGEAMQKGYLSGRYGAVPVLERFRF